MSWTKHKDIDGRTGLFDDEEIRLTTSKPIALTLL